MLMEDVIMCAERQADLDHPPIRPNCSVIGCPKQAELVGKRGDIRYRRESWIAEKYGIPKEDAWSCTEHHQTNLGIGGWDYKKFRKDYCENLDGRLGWKCTYVPPPEEFAKYRGGYIYELYLQVDHIDGDHRNNEESNLQTLCGNCHQIKTNLNGDGRKKNKY